MDALVYESEQVQRAGCTISKRIQGTAAWILQAIRGWNMQQTAVREANGTVGEGEKSESIKALKASAHSEDITQYKTKTSYNKIEMKFRYRVSVHVIGK